MKILSYLFFLLRYLAYKLKFKKKLKIGKHCRFNHDFHCNIEGKTSIIIGDKNTSRGYVMIRTFSKGKIRIGKCCFFNSNFSATSAESIVIGDGCIFGNNVVIVDHNHNYQTKDFQSAFSSKEVYIGNNCWIGANVVILKGTKIGNDCVIGAGTVVRGDVPANTIVYNENSLTFKEYQRH